MTLRERWQSWTAIWRTVAGAAAAIGVISVIASAGWAAATIRATQEKDLRRITADELQREAPGIVEAVLDEHLAPVRADLERIAESIDAWRESDLQWRLESVQARASKDDMRELELRMQRELDRLRGETVAPQPSRASVRVPVVGDVWAESRDAGNTY